MGEITCKPGTRKMIRLVVGWGNFDIRKGRGCFLRGGKKNIDEKGSEKHGEIRGGRSNKKNPYRKGVRCGAQPYEEQVLTGAQTQGGCKRGFEKKGGNVTKKEHQKGGKYLCLWDSPQRKVTSRKNAFLGGSHPPVRGSATCRDERRRT